MNENNIGDIAARYDAEAPVYDHRIAANGWIGNDVLRDRISVGMATADYSPESVLDLGAGTGKTSEVVTALFSPNSLVAVDISSMMLDGLNRRFTGSASDISVVESGIDEYLRTETRQFDLIVSVGALQYIKDLRHTVALTASRLAPRGRLFFTYAALTQGKDRATAEAANVNIFRFREDEVMTIVEDAGMDIAGRGVYAAQPTGNRSVRGAYIVADKFQRPKKEITQR